MIRIKDASGIRLWVGPREDMVPVPAAIVIGTHSSIPSVPNQAIQLALNVNNGSHPSMPRVPFKQSDWL
jgi:hypothetical protein